MGGEPDDVESVDVTESGKAWPLMSAERYEVRFTDSYLSGRRDPNPPGVRLGMIVVGILGVIGVLAAAAMAILWITGGPASPNAFRLVLAAVLVGAGLIIASAYSLRRIPGKVLHPELGVAPSYAFSITPTTIEFPASRYHAAASWSRASTVATVTGDDWTRRLVLSYPGERKRFFVGWTMTDTPDGLAARIGRRISDS